MANNHRQFLVLLIIIIGELIISVFGVKLDNDFLKKDIFSIKHFNIPNTINEILSQNWTDNQDCLIELNAIKSGLENDEQWAINGKLNFPIHL